MNQTNEISRFQSSGTLTIVIAVLLWLLLTSTFLSGVPAVEQQCSNYGVRVPAVTKFVMNINHWIRGVNVGQAIPGFAIVFSLWSATLLVPFILMISRARRAIALRILQIESILMLLALATTLVSLTLPLTAINQSMQGGKL